MKINTVHIPSTIVTDSGWGVGVLREWLHSVIEKSSIINNDISVNSHLILVKYLFLLVFWPYNSVTTKVGHNTNKQTTGKEWGERWTMKNI